jgi:hypothetical protein
MVSDYSPAQVAGAYAAQFAARTTFTATGHQGWRPVRETLAPEVVLAGLTGKARQSAAT